MSKRPTQLTAAELRISTISAIIMALRLFGLFAILPIFTIYALNIPGANLQNVGLTLGIYGLAAIISQPIFGYCSDQFSRIKIIRFSLIIFIIGSLISAFATDISLMMLGRFLQGTGGIGSATMAYIADHTRNEVRSKAMTMASMLLTLSFICAMMLSPTLGYMLHLPGLFGLTAFLGLLALIITGFLPRSHKHTDDQINLKQSKKIFTNKNIMLVILSAFVLHVILLANFVILPNALNKILSAFMNETWLIYLGSLLASFVFMLILINIADSRKMHKQIIVFAIFLIILSEILFMASLSDIRMAFFGLVLFFTGFITLETILPAILTRLVRTHNKGTALGFYVSFQFLGAFIGGWFGGCFGAASIREFLTYILCISVLWFLAVTSIARKEDLH